MPKDVQRLRLEDALRSSRRNGYATSRGEIFAGAVAVSAPVFDHRGSVVGSVGLYGPNARVNEDKILEFAGLVNDAGRRISGLLGFQGDYPSSNVSSVDRRSSERAAEPPRKLARSRTAK
jgi:DNA-binding IclR family transcriptional regulator